MDFNKLTLFSSMKKRLDWLSQRQKVLSQNIANADTPHYRSHDLKPLDFKNEMRSLARKVEPATTDPRHLVGRSDDGGPYRNERARKPYETAPAGNSVILEEQVMKVSETGIQHQLTTELYKKNLRMFMVALGKS